MLGKITASITPWIHPVDSQVEHATANEYLINMEYVIDVEDKTSYRILRYKFNIYDDRQTDFSLYVGETMAAIQALADVSQDANMINLDVFEGIQSFNQISGLTAVETAFNVSAIVWGDTDEGDDYTRLWYQIGGKEAVPVIVDHTIEEIITKL